MSPFRRPPLPEEVAARIPPGQHLVKGWPVLHVGPVPPFDESTWDLRVFGLVERPFALTYPELRSLGAVRVRADMHCVTGWTTLDNEWEGVPFRVIADQARPRPEARWVVVHCEYGYTANLSLQALLDDDVLLAWGHNGQPLTPEHGFPLRLVVPKRYGWKSAKWVRRVEFTDRNQRGYWEVRGYHTHADPWREERYSYQEGPGSEAEP
ncbi:MAG TPA: sulfite oxidase-like oxidoreductase [Actinomycetota bacterium]|nr:sulfite oxidase-like oxidoreductase [Actinomycetota bacterium]